MVACFLGEYPRERPLDQSIGHALLQDDGHVPFRQLVPKPRPTRCLASRERRLFELQRSLEPLAGVIDAVQEVYPVPDGVPRVSSHGREPNKVNTAKPGQFRQVHNALFCQLSLYVVANEGAVELAVGGKVGEEEGGLIHPYSKFLSTHHAQ